MDLLQQISETNDFLRSHKMNEAEVGIILGTGLGNLSTKIENAIVLDYPFIPHFPVSTVESHHGKLIYGNLSEKKVLAMQGRFHFYEGYSMQQITFPVRVMKKMGIKYLLISNAAGGVNLNMKKGSLMLIEDHINLQPNNPLTGKNLDELGPRFPDMSNAYDSYLREQFMSAAKELNLSLHQGVYAAVQGPNLETKAEYRFLKLIGADAVGMSTVPEVLVANHAGIPVAAVSVITDECDPENLKPVNISEILEIASKAELKLSALFEKVIQITSL